MKSCYTFIFFLISVSVQAQTVVWAKNLERGNSNTNFFCDKFENLFIVGGVHDGRRLRKYDKNGTEIFIKNWPSGMVVNMVNYDNANNLYFAGYYINNTIVDNFSLYHHGSADAVLGKMDLEGNVIWVKTINSELNNRINSIDIKDNRIFFTGDVAGEIFYNNKLIANVKPSVFIGQVDLEGNDLQFRTYDFFSEEFSQYKNSGLEITVSNNDDIYLLYWRIGFVSLEDMDNRRGIYIAKLNKDFDFEWNRFLSGDTYYNYDMTYYFNLKTETSGNIFLISKKEERYGFQGDLHKLDKATGEFLGKTTGIPFQYHYYDYLFTPNNDVILTGKEAINHADIQDGGNPGYVSLRLLNNSFDTLILRQFMGIDLTNIAMDQEGFLYMIGRCLADSVIFDGHSVSSGAFMVKFDYRLVLNTIKGDEKGTGLMQIYPNPSASEFNIFYQSSYTGSVEVKVRSISGAVVYQSRESIFGTFQKQINLSNSAQGIYFVELQTEKERLVRKIVVGG